MANVHLISSYQVCFASGSVLTLLNKYLTIDLPSSLSNLTAGSSAFGFGVVYGWLSRGFPGAPRVNLAAFSRFQYMLLKGLKSFSFQGF